MQHEREVKEKKGNKWKMYKKGEQLREIQARRGTGHKTWHKPEVKEKKGNKRKKYKKGRN